MKQMITTPRGICEYPSLNKPDTKFVAEGVYKTGLYLEGKEAEDLKDQLQSIVDKFIATLDDKNVKRAELPLKKPTDDRTGIVFNFKCKASGTRSDGSKWKQTPKLFDASGKPFTTSQIIWGGTVAKITFEPVTYFTNLIGAGVSLRLKAVQVLDLVEGGSSAQTYGFTKEEGFVANEVETNEEIQEEPSNAANYY